MRPPNYRGGSGGKQRRIVRRKRRSRPVLHPDKAKHGYTPVDVFLAALEAKEDRP